MTRLLAARPLRRLFTASLLLLTAAGAWAADPTLVKRDGRYHLHPSDLLQVDFRLSPEFNASVPVQPDGFITLPDLGDVKVGGLSLADATAAIKTKAEERLKDPEVTVELKQFEKPFITVGGEVEKPGKVELQGDVTALEAIQLAGGVGEGANTTQVILIRRVDADHAETKLINCKYVLRHYQANEDVAVQSGDMLIVPRNFVATIAPYVKIVNWGVYFDPTNP